MLWTRDEHDQFPSAVNLTIFVNECPACASAWTQEARDATIASLHMVGLEGRRRRDKFEPMSRRAATTWSDLQASIRSLAADVIARHRCAGCELAGQSVEWASRVSRAFDPNPQSPPLPPFASCPSWTRNMNMLDLVGMSHVKEFLLTLWSPKVCTEVVTTTLKMMSIVAKASAPHVPEASWLVDLARWRGHLAPLSGEELRVAALKWLCVPHEQVGRYSLAWVVLNFAIGTAWAGAVFGTPLAAPYSALSENFWSARPWGTTGASDKYNIYVATGERAVRAPKTKNMLALYSTTSELQKMCYAGTREVILVGPKFDEYGKARHILRGDDPTYLLHSYADQVLFQTLNVGEESRRCPITSSANDWRLVLRAVGKNVDARLLNVQFDHSGFDEHQSVFLVRAFLLYLVSMAWTKSGSESGDSMFVAAYMSATQSSLIKHPSGEIIGRHLGGLPSGWRWTALLDTMLNLSCTLGAWNLHIRNFKPHLALMLGDDSLVQVTPALMDTAFRVAGSLDYLGYELNPYKNYLSCEVADFLGYSFFGADAIYGAPSRLQVSITCRHNQRADPGGQYNVALARIWLWAMFLKRAVRFGGRIPDLKAHIIRDVAGASGLDAFAVVASLETPRSEGGVGMFGVANFLKFPRPTRHLRAITLVEQEFEKGTPIVPPTLREVVAHPGLEAALREYLQACGSLAPLQAAKWGFRPATPSIKPPRGYASGAHLTVPICTWKQFAPVTIQSGLLDAFTRRRDEFEEHALKLLEPGAQLVYGWLKNRGHSWAVIRAWLTSRLPSHHVFDFKGDELDLITPKSTTQETALSVLSARDLNMSSWWYWIEHHLPQRKLYFDTNWVGGSYRPKPDDNLTRTLAVSQLLTA
nr:RNA-dependent RNA polymerase [Molussus totiviridae 1]